MPSEPSTLKTEQLALDFGGGKTFFCHACLEDRPLTEQRQDATYCNSCYQFLKAEAAQLPPGRYPKWVPVAPVGDAGPRTDTLRRGHNSAPTVSMAPDKPLIMSSSKRGPKHKVLPWDLIIKLAAEGMSPKAIAARLCAGQGLKISHKTIERKLKGRG